MKTLLALVAALSIAQPLHAVRVQLGRAHRRRHVEPTKARNQRKTAAFMRDFDGERLIFAQRARLRRSRIRAARVGAEAPGILRLANPGCVREAREGRGQDARVGARFGEPRVASARRTTTSFAP